MRIGKSKNPSKYKCDKCGEIIYYEVGKGFKNVNKYYKWNNKEYAPRKDFDLCNSCEKDFRKWLEEKPLPTFKSIIEKFPKYKE